MVLIRAAALGRGEDDCGAIVEGELHVDNRFVASPIEVAGETSAERWSMQGLTASGYFPKVQFARKWLWDGTAKPADGMSIVWQTAGDQRKTQKNKSSIG